MKRIKPLWHRIITLENLHLAYRCARKGKQQRPAVAEFSLNLEQNLVQLLRELVNGTYQPGVYRQFTIYERKQRLICAALFRDRVVHHAIMNVLEPEIDKRFIFDSYACRRGKGVHAAVNRYQGWAQRYAYVLKMDVSQYFPSIYRPILFQQLRRMIKDPPLLDLLDIIIFQAPSTQQDDCRGMPIGNLTSQVFANVYLNGLDHFIKESLKAKGYLRYVDDLVLLADSKAQLWGWHEQIKMELKNLSLLAHPHKSHIMRTADKVDVFGYQVSRTRRWLRNENGWRAQRRLAWMSQQYADGLLEWHDIHPRMMSWIGHAQHGETQGLREQIFAGYSFKRACPAGR